MTYDANDYATLIVPTNSIIETHEGPHRLRLIKEMVVISVGTNSVAYSYAMLIAPTKTLIV